MATQLMTQSPENIRKSALASLENGYDLLNKTYLAQLGLHNPMILTPNETLSYGLDVRLCKVERIVLENKQSALESLTAAYTALGSAGYAVFLLLRSDGKATDVYLGVRGQPKKMTGKEASTLLEQVFKGHFSGSQLAFIDGRETERLLFNVKQTQLGTEPSVTAVSGIPSIAVEEREHFMQGLEKFIDAAEGNAYHALILAEPLGSSQLNLIQRGYENVATQLSPLLKQSLSFGQNETEGVSLALSQGLSQSLGTSLGLTETKGTSETLTDSKSTTIGTSDSHSKSLSTTESQTESTSSKTTESKLGTLGAGLIGAGVGFLVGGPTGAVVGAGLGMGGGSTVFDKQQSSSSTTSTTHGTTDTHTKSFAETTSSSSALGASESTASSYTQTNTDTVSINRSQTDSRTLGSSKQITLESTDKQIEQLLKQVDHQLERIAEARRYGAWHSAAYFVGDSTASSRSLASIFLGLMRGQDSNSEQFALTTWNSEKSKMLLPWLCNLTHPRLMSDLSKNLNIPYLTPATLVSGKEMAIQLSLPRRSTSTVSVLESQAFGRQIQNVDGENKKAESAVDLGVIRHLWQDLPQKVELDVAKLASHIFITGSTGSGKSNTVYQLLDQLNQNDVKFMVIEPAKGEYKNVFGHREDVTVLGTNPMQAKLLNINPFKFPNGIHVLEHIDRLVEIFNVCWPMYAAMPAVLKEAMLASYQACGWDLDTSSHPLGDKPLFPTFSDLLSQLENVIKQSAFSEEVKSNYIGSLVTRVKSLTNGLNGQIFTADEMDNGQLFDDNVIVDLSRVGSQETKSLIMGILVMRLSEHRMSNAQGMNQPLKHVTVLEEAHNILKRTSTEQSSEGANVAGKAVEMLSNAIAEMRTYGEGFIIADQSPSAVDISAIRNTNTKIIMRLPDEEDRRLAGKASGVTDEQLEEIAKLPKGVAVVYQNDWLEPVLCHIHHFEGEEKPYQYNGENPFLAEKKRFQHELAELLFSQKTGKRLDFAKILQSIEKSKLSAEHKHYFLSVLSSLENGVVEPVLEKSDDYLIDLYQRLIQQEIDTVRTELSVELQQHLSQIA